VFCTILRNETALTSLNSINRLRLLRGTCWIFTYNSGNVRIWKVSTSSLNFSPFHFIFFCLITVHVSIISCNRFSLHSLLTEVLCFVSLANVSLPFPPRHHLWISCRLHFATAQETHDNRSAMNFRHNQNQCKSLSYETTRHVLLFSDRRK